MDSRENNSSYQEEAGGLFKRGSYSFDDVYENMSAGIAIVDNDGSCFKVNSRLCEILGYSKPELPGTGFKRLMGLEEIWTNPRLRNKNPLGNLRFQDEEKCCFKKDGSKIWTLVSTSFGIDPENIPDFIVFYIEDISRQKNGEIPFGNSERSFDSIFKNVNVGITISEQVGKFLEVNRIICDKLGYSREEFLKKTPADLITPESSKLFAKQVRELYRKDHAVAQITAVSKEGKFLPLELNLRLVEYKGKYAIFSIVREIGEIKK